MPRSLQFFTFLIRIICFLPDYRKKKTRKRFYLVEFYVFDDSLPFYPKVTPAPETSGANLFPCMAAVGEACGMFTCNSLSVKCLPNRAPQAHP
jgi:hypothetical protein